jgi:uncharacterized membrane protein
VKHFFQYLMALLYTAAGINHFLNPKGYIAIMPPWIPAPALMVFISGVVEVLLAILLAVPATQRIAAWGIICLLVAVFPANVQMMLNYADESHPHLWLAVLRLPLQLFLIWWAYQYTKRQQ